MKQLTTLILILVFHLPTPVLAAEPDWLTHPGRWPIMGLELNQAIFGNGAGFRGGVDVGWLVLETGAEWQVGAGLGTSPTGVPLKRYDGAFGYIGFNPIALVNGYTLATQMFMGHNHWSPGHRNFFRDLLLDSQTDISFYYKKTSGEATPSWHPGFTLGLRLPGPWMGWRISYGQILGKWLEGASLNLAVYPFSPVLESYPQ